MKAAWQPRQAGTGDPYPPGGGANLLDMAMCTPLGPTYTFGMTCGIDGDVVAISGVPNIETEMARSFNIVSNSQTELRGQGYVITPFAIEGTIQSAWGLRTADEEHIAISATLYPGVENTIKLRLTCSQNALTEYAPYSNIRPISGVESATVTRCGKNLWNFSLDGTGAYWIIPYLPAGTYTMSMLNTADWWTDNANENKFFLRTLDGSMLVATLSFSSTAVGERSYATFEVPNGGGFRVFTFNTDTPTKITDIQLELGSTATSYTPYAGTTATLSLPSTVYGGEVDVATGQGQETYAMVELDGTENITVSATDTDGVVRYGFDNNLLSGAAVPTTNSIAFVGVCSHYLVRSADDTYLKRQGASINPSGNFIIYDPNFANEADATAFKAYLAAQKAAGTPVTIAYKLATPTSITATGGQQIVALEGVNTIFTDANGVTVTFLREDGNEQANVTGNFADSSDGYASTVSEMNEISVSGEDVELTKLEIDYVPQVR